MAQKPENEERKSVATKTKKAAPKKRKTSKRKKTTKIASSSTARRKRVKRTPPKKDVLAVATATSSESSENVADTTVAGVATDASAKIAPAPAVIENDSKTPPKSRPRTLKRAKPRVSSTVSSDVETNGTTRKRVTKRRSAASRAEVSPGTEESKASPPATPSAKSQTAAVAKEAASIASHVNKSKEPFGAGIGKSRRTTSDASTATGESTPATQPGSEPSGEARSAPNDESDAGKDKPKSRRKRGGKGRRKKTTVTGNTGGTDTAKAAPTDATESESSADGSEQPGETEEERKARVVLKRRPIRRARRSKSRGKTDGKTDRKTEAKSGPKVAAATESTIANEKEAQAQPKTKDTDAKTFQPGESSGQPGESSGKSTSTRGRRRRRGQSKSAKKVQTETSPAPVAASIEVADDLAELAEDISVITDDSPKVSLQSEGREMIINSTAGAECRIAILHNGRLEEIYIERQSAASHVGNIYKGKITNVESSIQAAFVDFGLAKNGFLHISDVLPKYFPNKADATEDVGKKVPRRDRPPIQKCFRRGDEVIVQVAKEGVGTKGPTLTTYLSIPGRFVVMMPGMSKLGVSRRIEDDADRKAMRDLLGQLTMPEGMGFILRTAGLNRNKRELQSDLNYLNRLWKTVQKRIKNQATPCELYQESDLVIRTIRDVYSSDFKRIVVDDHKVAVKAKDFLRIAMPRTQGDVVAYQKHEPIFHHYGIEQEIQRIYSRHVPLPSGGSIVIDSTEAMVAIDVNSGKYRDQNDAEETAYRINLEAAEEIARQLRLRDLGGLVVCDFIDMRLDRHKRAVEKALRDALKLHKERARILRMSKFGLIEMTRQRQGPSIKRSVFVDCRHCSGSGLVKTAESMSLEVLRIMQLLTHRDDVAQVVVSVAPDVCTLVVNEQRSFLNHLETKSNKKISILPDPTFTNDQVSYKAIDDRGMPLRIEV